MRGFATLVIALAFSLFLASMVQMAANDRGPIQLQVSPRIGFAPSPLRIFVRLTPADSDRWLEVEAESAEGVRRSSRWTLDGLDSQTFWRVDWRDMLAGHYEVIASVGNLQRTRASAHESVQLIGR